MVQNFLRLNQHETEVHLSGAAADWGTWPQVKKNIRLIIDSNIDFDKHLQNIVKFASLAGLL